jgi:hypothetical protein
LGWFEIGIIPFVGGIAFTSYDDSVTEQFITKVSPSYGPFVAAKIVSAIKPAKTVTSAKPTETAASVAPAETANSIKPAETATSVSGGTAGATESQAK